MSKYGLQLRANPSQQKKQPAKPPLPPPKGFSLDDDDDDVEDEIARHASKNKARKEIEEQQRKALEEDPLVFDYDGHYDEMKEKSLGRKVQERADTQPKYIQRLIQKAEERKREHDIIYERKLAKERSKEDHLFEDKDKFVTSAYKKKLAEQQRWAKEQALRDIRDERDDVTKKTDLSDFYFNLQKNIAFGGRDKESMTLDKKDELTRLEKHAEKKAELRKPEKEVEKKAELRKLEKEEERGAASTQERERLPTYSNSASESSRVKEGLQGETSTLRRSTSKDSDSNPESDRPVSDSSEQEKPSVEKPSDDQPKRDHHKRTQDALAAAKERFWARKKAKEQ